MNINKKKSEQHDIKISDASICIQRKTNKTFIGKIEKSVSNLGMSQGNSGIPEGWDGRSRSFRQKKENIGNGPWRKVWTALNSTSVGLHLVHYETPFIWINFIFDEGKWHDEKMTVFYDPHSPEFIFNSFPHPCCKLGREMTMWPVQQMIQSTSAG